MIAPSTAIDQGELTNDQLEQVAGRRDQDLYRQTLGLLMKAMGA